MRPARLDASELPLSRLFGNSSARVTDFLLVNEGLRYTEAEISEHASVPPRTLHRILQNLLDEQIIVRMRVGRTYYYATNPSSIRTAGLLRYMNATLMDNLDHIMQAAKKRQRESRAGDGRRQKTSPVPVPRGGRRRARG